MTLQGLKQRDTVFEEKNGTLESCLDNLKWILCDGLHRIAALQHIRARSDLDKKWVDNLPVSVVPHVGLKCDVIAAYGAFTNDVNEHANTMTAIDY